MNKNKFLTIEEPAIKVTIVITRKQLWNNFVESWSDVAWEEYHGIGDLQKAADVLLSGVKMDAYKLRNLFHDGWTCFLMGDAMEELEAPRANLLREIVIRDLTDSDQSEDIVIHHADIVF